MVLVVLGDQGAGHGFALDDDVDLDGHLLAAAHDEQVGVLDVAPDRMDVQRLGQRELLLAVDVERSAPRWCRSAAAPRRNRGAGSQQVLRVGAVAVQRPRDLPCARARRDAPLPVSVRTAAVRLVRGGSLSHVVLLLVPVVVSCAARVANHADAGSRR